jgi:two-component system NtrC family sensor kinase
MGIAMGKDGGEQARKSEDPAPVSDPAPTSGGAPPSIDCARLERHRMAGLATLSAGVAHQINNPLTYLLLNLESVLHKLRAASASDRGRACGGGRNESGPEGLTESLEYALEGANRIKQVVHDLLIFARGNEQHRGLVDLRHVLESATRMAHHEICPRARLSKVLAEAPFVDANEARLAQVFLGLLVNAAQAIPEGHEDQNEVRVATRTDAQGNAVVEIADTGTGIAPEDLPRVFDPFFTTRGFEGKGLGLSIAHGTIKSLGGEIAVTSAVGRGTTFYVVLPPADGSRRCHSGLRTKAAPAGGDRRALKTPR